MIGANGSQPGDRFLDEGIRALDEEIGRLELLKERMDAARQDNPGREAAQLSERIQCTLLIATASLERDRSLLVSGLGERAG